MKAEEIVRRFVGKRVLVIGDVMLDKSIYYRMLRPANEFQGDVLEEVDRTFYPGGAANVAMNCRSLGAQVTLLGAFGTDLQGQHLHSALSSRLIEVPTVAWEERRFWDTTTKTRVHIDGTPLHRIDHDAHQSLELESVLSIIRSRPFDLLLLSDYQKGVFRCREFINSLIQQFLSRNHQGTVCSNPKPALVPHLPYVDLVSVNAAEFEECSRYLTPDSFQFVLQTQGADGLRVYARKCSPFFRDEHSYLSTLYKANSCERPDVVGCGDATFAAASLVMSVYPSIDSVGKLAVAAGTAKARKQGTMSVTPEEILSEYGSCNS